MLKRGYQTIRAPFTSSRRSTLIAMSRSSRGATTSGPATRYTLDMMQSVAIGMSGKRLRYRDLIADNGLPSGARQYAT